MPAVVSVTFRDQITGKINDLLLDEDKACAHTQNLLAYLAGALVGYRDEGVEFLPSIVICDNIQTALQAFPGAVKYEIGQAPLDPASGRRILKDCAPLSNTNWFVYIERIDATSIKYGVFTYLRLPTAISLSEGITIGKSQLAVLLRRVSSNTIELRASKGSVLTLVFSTLREPTVQADGVSEFAAKCCIDLPAAGASTGFSTYFRSLLDGELSSSHGTILACAAPNVDLAQVPGIADAVLVRPALDFHTAFSDYHSTRTADSILGLQRCEELLRGFLRCDGIVVFDTTAKVVAYRMFYRPSGPVQASGTTVVGGARRRAFEGLKGLVGPSLKSVLFRSQDGLTLHHGDNNG